MKLRELDQHCGNCSVIEYCGNPFGYCLCCDSRFGDMDENEYRQIAATATGLTTFDACVGCDRPDCESYRYSKEDYADEDCEHNDDARDYYCEQIAEMVLKQVAQTDGVR